MEILRFDYHDIQVDTKDIVACIGYFDGLHVGHQRLIETAVQDAHLKGAIPALITFDPDPWVVLKGHTDIPHITPLPKRFELMERMGIERCIILEFTRDFANLSIDEFHDILKKLHVVELICGNDFSYGVKGLGNLESLKEANLFEIKVVEEVRIQDSKVSSSTIEEYIKEGKMHEASLAMNRPYSLSGLVVHGRKLGREIGFPTANLKLLEDYVAPKIGVYVSKVRVQEHMYKAITSVGYNPTVSTSNQIQIESFLFDFEDDIYDQEIEVSFLTYIRPEYKFDTIDELIVQMEKDEAYAIAYFKR